MRKVIYKCPSCGAIKEIHNKENTYRTPPKVICGWRGCGDYAVPHTK